MLRQHLRRRAWTPTKPITPRLGPRARSGVAEAEDEDEGDLPRDPTPRGASAASGSRPSTRPLCFSFTARPSLYARMPTCLPAYLPPRPGFGVSA